LTFSLPWIKRKEIINPEANNCSQQMGVTEEGTFRVMRIKKAGLPGKKVKGLFCFAKGVNFEGILFVAILTLFSQE
jgi:hypothetical protein